MHDIAHYLRPGHLAAAAQHPRRPRGAATTTSSSPSTCSRTPTSRPAACCRCARTPAPRSSWASAASTCSPTGTDEEAISRGRLRRLHAAQPALLADGADHDVGGEEHRLQPAGPDRALRRHRSPATRRIQVPLHGQGRRLGQQELPLPGDQGDPQRGGHDALPRREAPLARHGGLPALPPRHRHRRHVRRVRPEDSQVRVGEVPRHAAQVRVGHGPRLPRPRARGEGARADPPVRHRRPVRRQVLLPRRAGRPPAPPRRVPAGRHRRLVLGRPPGARQDHRRRRLPRAARDRPGAVPARRLGRPRRARGRRGRRQLDEPQRRRQDRPQPADGRDPRRALASTRSRRGCRSPGRWSSRATSRTPRSRSGSTPARRCRSTSRTTRSTTPARPRRPRACRPARSGRPRRAAWTPTSTSSRPPAARMVMLAKGNRSKQVTDACKAHGGFYLGSIGGPAARLAQDCIKKVEVLEYPELGMEAVWKIEVEDFPAFIVVDDKGNDFFAEVSKPMAFTISKTTRTPMTERKVMSENASAENGFDDLLEANRAYADRFELAGFDGIAHAGVAIVTCMDSRIDPLGHARSRAGRRQDLPQPGWPRGRRGTRGARPRRPPAQRGPHPRRAAHPLRHGVQHRGRAARTRRRECRQGRVVADASTSSPTRSVRCARTWPGSGRTRSSPTASRSAASSTTSTRACSAPSTDAHGAATTEVPPRPQAPRGHFRPSGGHVRPARVGVARAVRTPLPALSPSPPGRARSGRGERPRPTGRCR